MSTVGWPGHNDMRPIDWTRLWALIRSVRKTGQFQQTLKEPEKLNIATAIKKALEP